MLEQSKGVNVNSISDMVAMRRQLQKKYSKAKTAAKSLDTNSNKELGAADLLKRIRELEKNRAKEVTRLDLAIIRAKKVGFRK